MKSGIAYNVENESQCPRLLGGQSTPKSTRKSPQKASVLIEKRATRSPLNQLISAP